MAAFPFEDFISEYEYRGSAVTEQILNLTKEEKEKLLHSLVKISRYEDWTYRYNFLYDNCTTRARDQIENCVNGKITYPKRRNTGKLSADNTPLYERLPMVGVRTRFAFWAAMQTNI